MNWNAALFFYIFVAFVIYVFAAGDQTVWKHILTTRGLDPSQTPGSGTAAGTSAAGGAAAAALPALAHGIID